MQYLSNDKHVHTIQYVSDDKHAVHAMQYVSNAAHVALTYKLCRFIGWCSGHVTLVDSTRSRGLGLPGDHQNAVTWEQ